MSTRPREEISKKNNTIEARKLASRRAPERHSSIGEKPMALTRVLEPEVMDSPDEARDYDAMDHSDVNRLFVGDFLTAAQRLLGQRSEREMPAEILDLGTGTAQIPVEL